MFQLNRFIRNTQMRRALACGFSCLLSSTALAKDCTAPPFPPTVADYAERSGFEAAEGKEPIEVQAQATLSPEGLAGLVGLLCAAEQIENARYRNRFVQGILHTVLNPDAGDLDQHIERFSTRLNVNIPEDAVVMLRSDIAHLEAEIRARRMVLIERLAERQAYIDEQEARIAELDERIAEQEARIAELDERIAEQEERIAQIREETARIRANIARLRTIRGDLELMINVVQGTQPLTALD